MPIYRCSSCGFVGEGLVAAGPKLPCESCGTPSTLFPTVFYVQKLVERYLAVRRELEAFKQLEIDPSGAVPSSEAPAGLAALSNIDLNNTDLLATEAQHKPLRDWLSARQIEAVMNLSAVDTTGYFDEAAKEIGTRQKMLAALIGQVRHAYTQSYSWLNFKLSKYSPEDQQSIVDFCRQLYSHTLFTRYTYKKQTQELGLGIQPAQVVRDFFLGAWLEWYVLELVLRLCCQRGREFSCARNLTLTLPNSEKRELDVSVLIEGRTLVIIECKTGEFRGDIGKYTNLRRRLGLDRAQFIICNPELDDDQLAGLGRMYDLTFANLGSLQAHLETLIPPRLPGR